MVNPPTFEESILSLNTAKTFSLEIEKIASEKNITHMEAVLDYCFRQGIEPDTVGNLISKSLREKRNKSNRNKGRVVNNYSEEYESNYYQQSDTNRSSQSNNNDWTIKAV